MKWSPKATQALDLFLRDTPPDYLERARRHAVEETERYCEAARIREVGYDQVVIGFIRATPAHLRMGLKGTLRAKGVIIERYEEHFMSP